MCSVTPAEHLFRWKKNSKPGSHVRLLYIFDDDVLAWPLAGVERLHRQL